MHLQVSPDTSKEALEQLTIIMFTLPTYIGLDLFKRSKPLLQIEMGLAHFDLDEDDDQTKPNKIAFTFEQILELQIGDLT